MLTLVYDTETTGLIKHPNAKPSTRPRIIEFAGVLVDERGDVKEELELVVNPGVALEAIITKITGLTDEDLRDAPRFNEAEREMRALFERAGRVVAHNLPFDSGMIDLEVERCRLPEWPWPAELICTVQEHAEEWGRRPKLTELYAHYMGEPLKQTHRALDDVHALAEVARACGVLKKKLI